MPDSTDDLVWIILTRGDRPAELRAAIASLRPDSIRLVVNGALSSISDPIVENDELVELANNVGIPAGRDAGVKRATTPLIGFLDDDAVASQGIGARVVSAFAADPTVGAVAMRLVDESGETARRHVPRIGGRGTERDGEVALFLGGACAIRREAYQDAGGYWGELFYGHEEVELAWRLIDRGWKIEYRPDLTVFHPRTEIGRHAEGWRMTGRNRVMIARRTLPWPVAILHVSLWLAIGLIRAPKEHRRSYLEGWRAGWRQPATHRPIRWTTVWRLTRLGRPPIV